MLLFFRGISVAEGLSFISILGVSLGIVPREFVYPIGMTHGVLFLLYVLLSLVVAMQKSWSLKIWLPIFLASVVPFAFVVVELFLKRITTTSVSEKAEAEAE